LDAGKSHAVVYDNVITRVFAEGNKDCIAGFLQRQQDGKRRPVADVLWVLHVVIIVNN